MSYSVVLVTGASAGVGRATALAFARKGAHVGLVARDPAALAEVQREIESFGSRAVVAPADVSNPSALRGAADTVESELGPIDVWVNNAMVSVFGPTSEATPEDFRRVTEVTYLGTVYGTLIALERMKPRRRGKIIQVGSALAYRGIPMQAPYCAAKHAIQGFTESLRTELLYEKMPIGLTMVQLPALNTPQFDWVKSRLAGRAQPVPPIFQPEVAANAIVWVASRKRRELYVGGSTVRTILGNKIAPGFADRYLARNGVDAQQTEEPEDQARPNNLYKPVHGLHRTHGRFDARSKSRSFQLWCVMHPAAFTATLGVVLGSVAFLTLFLTGG